MENEARNVFTLLNEVVLVSIALFFPVAMFMAILGA